MKESEFILVFVTTGSAPEAECIAEALVSERLAACVNIVPQVDSVFRWEGRIDRAREVLLIIKTTRAAISALIPAVRRLHPYDVPEVIALPIVRGLPAYLAWVGKSVSRRPARRAAS